MSILEYILKSGATLAVLLLFYKVFLERESIHHFKRYYLLGALLLSFLIPAIVLTEYVEATPQSFDSNLIAVSENNELIGVPQALEADILDIAPLLWAIYLLGVIFFGIKFFRNLLQISKRIRKNPTQKIATFVRVLLKEQLPPHTFFNYIFLNKMKLESDQIPKEVLLHEETHAKQKHSIDVLFIELLQLVFWFNPLIYLMRKSIKLNHEFLADQAVLDKGIDSTTYQNTLLSYSSKSYQPVLANAINYSSIKKRFTVMKSQSSKRSTRIKTLSILPLTILLLLSFSKKEIRYKDKADNPQVKNEILRPPLNIPFLYEDGIFPDPLEMQDGATELQIKKYNTLARKYNKQPQASRKIPLKDLKTLEAVYRKMTAAQKERAIAFPECPPQKEAVQEGASRKLMAEYNSLAKHYNNMSPQKMRVSLKDVKRLRYIYNLMSEKQRADAEPFPDFPPMPDPPSPAAAPQLASVAETAPLSAVAPSPVLATTESSAVKATLATIPPSPPSPEAPELPVIADVPPPPPPPNPLGEIIKLAKEDAIFYYRNKKISSDKAIEIIKENKDLSISVKRKNNNHAVVRISKSL